MKDLSIIITVYNSSDNLYKLIDEINKYIKFEYEVIFVNDSSLDDSWEIICKIAKKYKNITGINLRKNFGQDMAIMTGISIAKGANLITIDDDLQHSPQDINHLMNEMENGYDVVYANFFKKNKSLIGRIGSWFNGKISEVILNKPKNIYLSPFRIIKKQIYMEMQNFQSPFPYVDGLILSLTDNISQINVEHHKRFKGKTNYTFKKSLLKFLNHFTGYSILPLRIIIVFGLINLLIGFIFSIYVIVNYIYTDVLEGWTSLFILTIFLGSTIMFALGIIGEYVGRSYLSLNKHNQFVIKEIVKRK